MFLRMTKHAKKPANGKHATARHGAARVIAPAGMIVTRSGRFIAKPVPGTIPLRKIRAALEKLPRARKD